MNIIKCECCNKFEARVKDYREQSGVTGKVLVCNWCRNLDNVTYYRIKAGGIDPLSFYEEIIWDKIPVKELQEIHDMNYDKVLKLLDGDETVLNKLLESYRALTLMEGV